MSRAFVWQSIIVSSAICLLAVSAARGGSASGPLPQTEPFAVGTQRSVSSVAFQPVQSTYKSIYSFKGGRDGFYPRAPLIEVNGALYGTAIDGGPFGGGTFFEVSTFGTESVIYGFGRDDTAEDARYPEAGLIDVNGVLYGTSGYGGGSQRGTVFAVSTSGTESVIHSFLGGADGSNPYVGRLINANGTLYGTTTNGGASGLGTVFAVTTSGTESVLHSFGGGTDGSYPAGDLIDVNGVLYGTTGSGGGHGKGTVFALSTSGTERVLHSFGGGADGAFPDAGLIDVDGALYGTTYSGGASGDGSVFAVSRVGNERVLYNFKAGMDGSGPFAGLVDVKGALHGTTLYGGVNNGYTVFAVSLSGMESLLHRFGRGADGSYPWAGLIYVDGSLYGTTVYGGASGYGTVFQVPLNFARTCGHAAQGLPSPFRPCPEQ